MNRTKSEESALFQQLKELDTEQRNEATMQIDLADANEIVRLINEEDKKVAFQVEKRLDLIAEAVEIVCGAFSNGGRLIFTGAGTSGRLGVVDAAECPPTFGSKPEQVQGLIAGGKGAMFEANEGAEDKESNGRAAVDQIGLQQQDVLCGLAASGRTPYVLGSLKEADERGCKTIFITTVPAGQTTARADIIIDAPVGPEVVMGSTRMKSASAQKMILNMITTGAFIRQGKVYENVMVDLMLTNEKLKERAKRILMTFSAATYDEAATTLQKAGGHVKTALLMQLGRLSVDDAESLLREHDGFIRKAYLSLQDK
jgi:N-acetylmuramic acid 6-phosphate etherase